jgi:hypothetical protein
MRDMEHYARDTAGCSSCLDAALAIRGLIEFPLCLVSCKVAPRSAATECA